MKSRDTRPGAVALDAASRRPTTPGVTPRPPTVDDDATVPRRDLGLGRSPMSDPLGSQPLLGAALEASLGGDTSPGPSPSSLGDTAPDAPRDLAATTPGGARDLAATTPEGARDLAATTPGGARDLAATTPESRSPFSAARALEATPLPFRAVVDPHFGDTAPSPQPAIDDALDALAAAAKKTDMIPERADSDGARNARFATEGRPARAVKMTMPTGEVLVDPEVQGADPPSAENEVEGMAVERSPRRRALPTAPSGRVLELEDRREYRREGVRGIVAGISIALALLAILLVGTLIYTRKPADEPVASGAPSASTAASIPAPSMAAVIPPPAPSAVVVSPVPSAAPIVEPTVAAHGPHGQPKAHPSAAPNKPAPSATAAAPPVPAPVPPPPASAPASSDITHNIH